MVDMPRAMVGLIALAAFVGCWDSGLGSLATTEEGHFLSGTTRLSYALDIPATGSPAYPMVVFGHDSSPEDKNRRKDWARMLTAKGISVLRFDKRGVGGSEGEYERGYVDFELVAGDLAAAVDFAMADARVDPSQIGLMG